MCYLYRRTRLLPSSVAVKQLLPYHYVAINRWIVDRFLCMFRVLYISPIYGIVVLREATYCRGPPSSFWGSRVPPRYNAELNGDQLMNTTSLVLRDLVRVCTHYAQQRSAQFAYLSFNWRLWYGLRSGSEVFFSKCYTSIAECLLWKHWVFFTDGAGSMQPF